MTPRETLEPLAIPSLARLAPTARRARVAAIVVGNVTLTTVMVVALHAVGLG